jgi:tetratricopeptide (TPR) repeat protein
VSWAGYRLGDIALMRGRLAESARYYAEAVEADRSRGAPAPPHTEALAAAGRAIFVRNDRSAGVQMLDQALASTPMAGIHPRTRPYGQVAAMYAAGGRPERAGAVLAEYVRDMRDSAELRLSAPEVHNARAELALAERRFDTALAEFRAGDMLPDGPVDGCTARLAASLGRVFDAAGLADSAIAQYEHYLAAPRLLLFDIDRPAHYTIPDAIWLPRARRRLAALYEQKGERAKAIAQYEAFIDLWSTADAELQPQVAAARQHLARLRGGT